VKIAVYGGSFNPPHAGHLKAVMDVFSQIAPDKILIVPAALPPHKDLPNGSPSADDRKEMARLFAERLPSTELCDIELNRSGKSYTVDTLIELSLQYPESQLYLLMGTDMLLTLENWYLFRRIIELATIVVFARDEGQNFEILSHIEHLKKLYGGDFIFIPREPLAVSSTELRIQLKNRMGAELIPDEVYRYIIKHRLYEAQVNLKWLREKSYAYHSPNRLSHIQGTEQEAVRLAVRWGADADSAAEAAILHDMTKKLSSEEQLILCDKYGIIADAVERDFPKLLHSKTGAALARDLFGVNDQVYDAILCHTTGKYNMSLLEKVIYLADYIEPNRDFDGVDYLRALAYADIDEAMVCGLQMSMEDIHSRGIIPHGRTIEALDFFLNNKGAN